MLEPIGDDRANQRPDAVETAIVPCDLDAIGSMSVAVNSNAPKLRRRDRQHAAAAAEIEHQMRRPRRADSDKAFRHNAVVSWWPVPKASPASMRIEWRRGARLPNHARRKEKKPSARTG